MASRSARPAALVYLVGPPAVGKLTIARELERLTGAIVVDNHLIADPVFVPMGTHRGGDLEATDALRARVLDVVLDAAAAAPAQYSHVFTNWLSDEPENAALVERLRALAVSRGARFVPVWLTASHAELHRRITDPSRTAKAKLTDPQVLDALLARPELPAPDDAICLDTTDMTPAEAARRIVAAIEH